MKIERWAVVTGMGIVSATIKGTRKEAIQAYIDLWDESRFNRIYGGRLVQVKNLWRLFQRRGFVCQKVTVRTMAYQWKTATWVDDEE